jgi:O-antigen ligase
MNSLSFHLVQKARVTSSFGFHADRIFLEGQHMHNALLHALVQTGLLGTIPYLAAIVGAWILVVRLHLARPSPGLTPLPIEIPAVLAFFTIASITESTFAFFGTPWLLCAPLLAYSQALAWQHRTLKSAASRALLTRVRFIHRSVASPPAHAR